MLSFFIRLRNLFKRPTLDIINRVISNITSFFWKAEINKCGLGFHIGSGSIVQGGKHITIGDYFYSGKHLWMDAIDSYLSVMYNPTISIGNYFNCSNFVHIACNNSVCIGDNVLIGSHVLITDHLHGKYYGELQDSPLTSPSNRVLSEGRPVHIGSNVWLCDGVVVLPGVKIGNGSIIGANSVVSSEIPPYVIAVGIPAKPIKRFNFTTGTWE